MSYKAKIPTKHLKQSEHQVEFLNVEHGGT
jgi:hypothetical protein